MRGRIKDLAEGTAKFFCEISYYFKIILSKVSSIRTAVKSPHSRPPLHF